MCVALFAFATIIAWYYMGRQAASYLGEAVGKDLVRIYTAGYLAAVFFGSLGPMELVWEVSDVLNGCMAVSYTPLPLRTARLPSPASLEKTPRAIPYWTLLLARSPTAPPAALRNENASWKIIPKAEGIFSRNKNSTAAEAAI